MVSELVDSKGKTILKEESSYQESIIVVENNNIQSLAIEVKRNKEEIRIIIWPRNKANPENNIYYVTPNQPLIIKEE